MFFIDPMYILMMLPAIIFAGIASFMVKSTFKKYSKVRSSSGMRGAQAAERMMQCNGIYNVRIEQSRGFLSDHYDPTKKVLRLSSEVYNSDSLAAIGVACHEAGHALQHANSYAPLFLRTALVPVTNFSSSMSFYILFAGILFRTPLLMYVGCAMFAVSFLFALVTLPVEWDATARAKQYIVTSGIVSPSQAEDSGKVLNAAFMTYVASAVSALLTLLYYLLRSGLLGGSDD
ncbi:MAG: zinc metallopeptidase [Kiritimatiellae bacterium]|jgi:Zn-dependent membrane protease YugP|nr:zinc metallopeptidase [Kiritimatiellia bacterium]